MAKQTGTPTTTTAGGPPIASSPPGGLRGAAGGVQTNSDSKVVGGGVPTNSQTEPSKGGVATNPETLGINLAAYEKWANAPRQPSPTSQGEKVAMESPLSRIETPAEGTPIPASVLLAQWATEAGKKRSLERHMPSCPANGRFDRLCQCPTNLKKGYVALEKAYPNQAWWEGIRKAHDARRAQVLAKEAPEGWELKDVEGLRRTMVTTEVMRDVELWRVDEGETLRVKRWHPIERVDVDVTETRPPLWVCSQCGWATRADKVQSHHCEPGALLWRAQPQGLAEELPDRVLQDGTYRLSLWRDGALQYHLVEELVLGERVVATRELGVDPDMDVALARIQDALGMAYVR